MSQQLQITGGAKVRDLQDVIIGTSGVLSSLAFNVANGVPKLDVNGKILVSQLPNSVMEYLGTWNAATNTPFLVNGTGNAGDVYLCNVAGTVDFGAGPISFVVSDQVIYSGSIWQKASGSNGTVTSVGLTSTGNDAITITGSPITTSGNINLGFAGTNLQYINGAGDLTTFPTLISSIGLSMPSAFNVSNSPLTANGTIGVTGAGVASQYIRGDGTLADFPTSGGGGSSVSYYLNGGTSQGVIGGITYYEMSKIADTGAGVDFPKTGNGLIVSFLTDAGDPAQLNIPAGNWNYEIYASMSANGGTPQLYAELYVYDGTTFTLISTSSNEILYDGTNLNLYTFAMAVPATTLAITDRLAVKLYATNSGGKTTTVHTQDGHLCQIITTFSTGITALNGLIAQVQFFQTGTSGTDFAINSSTATHTFNLPTASAANRGALSSADWTTFNNKLSTATAATTYVPYTGATANVTLGAFDLSADDVTLTSNLASLTRDVVNSIGILRLQKGANGYIQPTTLAVDRTYTLPDASGTIALTSNLSSYVPYTGATADVDLGVYNFKANIVSIASAGGSNQLTSFANTNSLHSASAGLNVFGFNTSNNIYFGKGLTGGGLGNGGVLIWSNTQVRYYTLPDADGTLALVGGSGVGTVTSVAALTLGTTGTDLSSTVANSTTTPVITLNVPTASATNRGALSSADWTTFNNKASTADLANYLPLAGGTLTGALNGTSAVFSSTVQASAYRLTGMTGGSGALYWSSDRVTLANYNATGVVNIEANGGTSVATFGGATYNNDFVGTLRNTTSAYFATTSGNVGIGNVSASYKLDVSGTGRFTGALTGTSAVFSSTVDGTIINSTSNAFRLNGNNALSLVTLNSQSVVKINAAGFWGVQLVGANDKGILIDNTGNVGIGTSTPNSQLSIEKNTSGVATTMGLYNSTLAAGSGGGYEFWYNSSIRLGGIYQKTTSDGNNFYMSFESYAGAGGATERMRITSGGDVVVNSNAAQSSCKLSIYYAEPSNNGIAIRETSNAGSANYVLFNSAGTQTGSISRVGSTAAVLYNTSSDYRLKEDLKEIKGLAIISKIKVYDFKWIGTNERMDGVLAHELQEILPYAVSGKKDELEKDGTIKSQGVDYSKIVPILVKAIQEQQIQIQNLQEQINILAK